MPDITLCPGPGCPLKNECYRYTAEPKQQGQSYADFTQMAMDYPLRLCPWFIPAKETK